MSMLTARAFAILLGGLLVSGLLGCPTDSDDDSAAADDDDVTWEEGCILINGIEPGFAHLSDALMYAQDGDNITICEGIFEGSVIIDKSVTLIGAGPESTVIIGDSNEMTLTVEAPDVSIAHIGVESTRNGIVALAVTGLVIDDVTIAVSGQYGISLNGVQASINGSTITNAPFGGIDVQNSTLTINGTTISDIQGYGIRMVGSTGTIANTVISNVTVPSSTDDLDGTCLYIEDTTDRVELDTVQTNLCQRVGVYWFDADVDMHDCTVTDSSNGIVGIGGGDDGNTVLANNYLQEVGLLGIYVIEMDAEITGNTVTADSADPNDSIGIACGNDDGTFTVTGNTVDGYKLYSMWVQYQYKPGPTGGTAVVSDNNILNAGLFGLYVSELDEVTFSGNHISGVRWSGSQQHPDSYSDGMAVGLFDNELVTMHDNEVVDADVVGYFILNSDFTSTNDTVSETRMWAMYISESAGTFTGLTVHDCTIYGVDLRTSAVDFSGCTFADNIEGLQPDDWDDPKAYPFGGIGILYNDAQGVVSGSTFSGHDDYGMYIFEANTTVEFSDFSDNYGGMYVNGDSANGYPITIQDNTFGSHEWASLYAYTSDATIQRNVFDGADGTGFYGSSFFGTVDDNTFTNAFTGVQAYVYDIVNMGGPGTYSNNTFTGTAVGISVTSYAGEMIVSGNTFDGVQSPISISDYLPLDEVIRVQGNTFTNPGQTPIDVADVIELEISGANTVTGSGSGPAILIDWVGTVSVDGATVTGSAGPGIEIHGGTVSVTGNDFTGSTGTGIVIDGSATAVDLTMTDNVAFSDGSLHGVTLTGTVTGSATGNTIEDNLGYGINCDSAAVTLSACTNIQSGNTLGDFLENNGCVLGCTVQ